MNRYVIYVDGIAYGGVDYDAGEEARPQMTKGWEGGSAPRTRDVLLWGGKPHVIQSHINLKGDLERILERIRDGSIDGQRIVIERLAPEETP